MFSVVILTLNEERKLAECLASAFRASSDVVVFDSGSTDRTREIAREAGARVFVHAFTDFAAQRNQAHASVEFRHPWVFHLDADERFTPELIAECRKAAGEASETVDGYWVAPRMMYRARWIRHCTDFPAYQARFVHARRFRFIQVGHGQREAPEMRMEKLRSPYVHDLSGDGEQALVEKHRRYARQEAAQHLQEVENRPGMAALLSRNPLIRRRALKAWSRSLPLPGVFRLGYQYVLRRGFLDGTPGWSYCLLIARYEAWIAAEIRRQRRERISP